MLTYILLAAVAVIWYKVFFRIKDNFASSTTFEAADHTSNQSFHAILKDTFELKANYRDPFTGSIVLNNNPVSSNNGGRINYNSEDVVWPDIKYYGLVKKSSSKSPLAIIDVNGTQRMVRTGELINDKIKVSRIWMDSLALMSRGETHLYYK